VTGGRLVGRPEGSRESRYLLTGISRCGVCGGSIYATRRSHGRHERFYHGCFYHRSRGAGACINGLTAPQDEINAEVLRALQRDVLAPATVEEIVAGTVQRWREEGAGAEVHREALEARLSRLDGESRNLTNALADGAPLAVLQGAIRERSREQADVRAHLEHLDGLARVGGQLDDDRLLSALRVRLADWQSLLDQEAIQARQILKKLVADRLTFEPIEDAQGVGYRIVGQATYGRLLDGVISVVPPG